jgi:hypothetical protein
LIAQYRICGSKTATPMVDAPSQESVVSGR